MLPPKGYELVVVEFPHGPLNVTLQARTVQENPMQSPAFVTVLELHEDGGIGQAERLGIQLGDAVLEANGRSLADLVFREAIDIIKQAGFPLKLSLLRKRQEPQEPAAQSTVAAGEPGPEPTDSSSATPEQSDECPVQGPERNEELTVQSPEKSEERPVYVHEQSEERAVQASDQSEERAVQASDQSEERAVQAPDQSEERAVQASDQSEERAVQASDQSEERAVQASERRGGRPVKDSEHSEEQPLQVPRLETSQGATEPTSDDPGNTVQIPMKRTSEEHVETSRRQAKRTLDEPADTARKYVKRTIDESVETARRSVKRTNEESVETSRRPIKRTVDEPIDTARRSAKRTIDEALTELGRGFARDVLHMARNVGEKGSESPIVEQKANRRVDRMRQLVDAASELPNLVAKAYSAIRDLDEHRNVVWSAVVSAEAAADAAVQARDLELEVLHAQRDALHRRSRDATNAAYQLDRKIAELLQSSNSGDRQVAMLEQRARQCHSLSQSSRTQYQVTNAKIKARQAMWVKVYDRLATRSKAVRSELVFVESQIIRICHHLAAGDALGDYVARFLAQSLTFSPSRRAS